jgi:hypothetical protein
MSKISERSNGKAPRPLFAIERDLAPRWAMLWVLICGLALMGAIATGTAVSVNKFEENAIENGKEGLESAVLLLARHFDQQFRDFLIPQEDLVTELQSQGIQSADIFQSEMGTLAVHEDLRIRITSWNDNAGVNLFDSNGILINSSRTWPMPDVKIGDRAYFRALRSDPSLPLAVEVVKSRLAGSSHAIVFARRISGARGQLLGVITRAISPEVLETFFASAVLGEGATIALHHRDGALLARYPQIGSLIGQNFKNGPSQQQAVFEAPHLYGQVNQSHRRHRPACFLENAFLPSVRRCRNQNGRFHAGGVAFANEIFRQRRGTVALRDHRNAVPDDPADEAAA